jgi:iron-sulfur cluster repair protein YtfE (RIC family)
VSTHIDRSFDITASVNDLLRDCPSALIALDAYGIDSCCGGDLSLSDAAREAGVSLEHLLVDIGRSLAGRDL